MSLNRSSIFFDIISEYRDKGAKQAEKSFLGLQGTAAKVAKSFAGLFAVQKVVEFGKASFDAFNKDNLAAKSLSQTLVNLGLAFDDNKTKLFIADMEKTYKVLDEQLRPAMQSLLQVTGSVNKSQEILKASLNLSAGTNSDLATATQALSQAYVGNLKGLKQFNLGLTQSELKAKSFDQILALINTKFKDQALINAADPMKQLAVATDNAKEIIGKGLVDAFNSMYSAGGKVNDLTANVEGLANAFSNVLRIVGKVSGFIAYGIKGLVDSGKQTVDFLTGAGGYGQAGKSNFYNPSIAKAAELTRQIQETARAKAERDAIARNKELLKLAQAQAAAAALAAQKKKEAAILEKAQQLFNMDLIENVAALQNKVNEDEKQRLLTQQAILTGNAESAGQLAMKLLEAQKQALLARQTDPFLGWTDSAASALKAINDMIEALKKLNIPVPVPNVLNPVSWGLAYTTSTGKDISTLSAAAGSAYYNGTSGGLYGPTPANQTITIVDATTGGVNAITQNNSLNGTPATVSRYNAIGGL